MTWRARQQKPVAATSEIGAKVLLMTELRDGVSSVIAPDLETRLRYFSAGGACYRRSREGTPYPTQIEAQAQCVAC